MHFFYHNLKRDFVQESVKIWTDLEYAMSLLAEYLQI